MLAWDYVNERAHMARSRARPEDQASCVADGQMDKGYKGAAVVTSLLTAGKIAQEISVSLSTMIVC